MLSILGRGATRSGNPTRRELLRVGGLSLFAGLNVPRLLEAASREQGHRRGRAKSVILFNLRAHDMICRRSDQPAQR